MIAVVDYGRGNLGSVQKALQGGREPVVVTEDWRLVERATTVVVPGDGAFADCMATLERLSLVEPLRAHIAADRPFLGICLGYQVLFTESEEFGHTKGLGVLPGIVRRFPPGERVPHMGWNRLDHDGTLPVLAGIPSGTHFYFVHSYYPTGEAVAAAAPGDAPGWGTATCRYGVTFPALVSRGRLVGTQFHPEKSQGWGLRLLANFARLAAGDDPGA